MNNHDQDKTTGAPGRPISNGMKVLIFSTAYFPLVGGAEIAVKELTDRMPEIEFDMLTLKFDASHAESEQIGNVLVHRVNASKLTFPFKAAQLAKRLHTERGYDATWSIMAAYAGLAALFFKFSHPKIPFVLTLQEGDSLEHIRKRMGLFYPLFRKIFTKADRVQAISTFLAEWAKDMGAKGKIEVIPNGVDLATFKNLQHRVLHKDAVKLITTSRLVEKNGMGDLIESLQHLPESVSLKIIGAGPLEKSLQLIASSLDLGTRVEFVGFVDQSEIPTHLHGADIFVRPSLSEGMGNSFIEAMAAGLPVVATPVGGIPDFITEGETGLFCAPHNPESIAQAVKRLIEDQSLRERVVSNGLKLVSEKYDWDLIAGEMKSKVFHI